MKSIPLLLLALPTFAANSGSPAEPAAAGRHPPAAVEAIDDLLGPEAPPPQSGGEYDDVLANGTAAARLEMGLALREAGGRTNLVRAARLIGRAAMEGDADAQYWLACLYESGEGMKRPDPEKAVYWAWTGAEATNGACMNLLGTFYERGVGMDRDEAAAADCYRRAADSGNAKGALNFALACEYGRGVPTNAALALAYYEAAARAGLAEGMLRTGLCHLYGTGTPRDGRAAAEWFARGARAGSADAAGFLGRCAARGIGMPKDARAALRWLREAVSAGDPEFRADLVRALRESGPDPRLRAELVAQLEASANGVPARCAAAIAEIFADPAWGEPDYVAAEGWLEAGGPATRAAAHAARQRVARASFDAAAARAESEAAAGGAPVLRGVRLGMPAETAARLVEAELASAGIPAELIVRPVPEGGVRARSDEAAVVGGEGEGSPLSELWLSRRAVDAFFGTKGRTDDEARLAVLGATGAQARCEERRAEHEVSYEGRGIGKQTRTAYSSPDGWELVFHGPLAVFDAHSLSAARAAGAFRPAGSLTLRRSSRAGADRPE